MRVIDLGERDAGGRDGPKPADERMRARRKIGRQAAGRRSKMETGGDGEHGGRSGERQLEEEARWKPVEMASTMVREERDRWRWRARWKIERGSGSGHGEKMAMVMARARCPMCGRWNRATLAGELVSGHCKEAQGRELLFTDAGRNAVIASDIPEETWEAKDKEAYDKLQSVDLKETQCIAVFVASSSSHSEATSCCFHYSMSD
ncbi:hypothetical protein ACLOJK_028056 [Asimina triloba]